jgi:hypothetical protein
MVLELKTYLFDRQSACAKLRRFTAGHTFADYDTDDWQSIWRNPVKQGYTENSADW